MSKFNKQRPAQADGAMLEPGLVVATYGRHCLVETPEGRRLICHPRGKKSELVVGDLRLEVRASFGVAYFPADGTTADALLDAADRRMYANKRQAHDPTPISYAI